MRECDLVSFPKGALLYIRSTYLKEIAYFKQRGLEDDYVDYLENEVCRINLELVKRGEIHNV